MSERIEGLKPGDRIAIFSHSIELLRALGFPYNRKIGKRGRMLTLDVTGVEQTTLMGDGVHSGPYRWSTHTGSEPDSISMTIKAWFRVPSDRTEQPFKVIGPFRIDPARYVKIPVSQ